MKSFQIGKYWGIPVRVHWTFGLLILMVLGFGLINGMDIPSILAYLFFIILMFGCVILHEYGHALTARKYGVKTLDIIISPIGGIARLQSLPKIPVQELIVAIAGPLVNLTIAALLLVVSFITFNEISFQDPEELLEIIATPYGFISLLIYINTVLFLFNLVPAFPMDGGRIFRALLAMKFGSQRGTYYASIVGRALAVVFVVVGIFMSFILVLIGVFVFIMAKSENEQVRIRTTLSKYRASDIMNMDFTSLHLSTSMQEVFQHYVRGGERNYLVFDSLNNVSGVLPEELIKSAVKQNVLNEPVGKFLQQNFAVLEEDLALDKLYEKMGIGGLSIVAIKNGGQIQGVIDRQMIYNFIKLQTSN